MIDPKDLTCIIVMENDSGIINYAIQSIIKFTNPCPKILICENTGNVKSKACERVPVKIKHPNLTIIKNPLGEKPFNTSKRHGLGLNKLMEMVKTKYTAIIESDVCLLSNNWFKLDEDKYDIKAAHRGKRDIDYWFVCFVLFKTEIFKGMNWCPDIERGKIKEIYNDTGWKMYNKIIKKQARIKLIDIAKYDQMKYFTNKFHIKTFELHEDNTPIAAHFGRGSDLARIKDYNDVVKNWSDVCEKILDIKKDENNPIIKVPANVKKNNRKPWKIGKKKKLK